MADQLVTPAELASYLQVAPLPSAVATLLIELATGKVQAAAGQLLLAGTATAVIDVDIDDCDVWLPLPQSPVRSVESVLIDDVSDTAWKLRKQQLWRLAGWNVNSSAPTQIKALFTYGYQAGAQHLQLARDMTFALAAAGFGNPGGAVQSEAIDDYRVTYADAESRMQVTDGMRDMLRDAYGTTAHVTRSRS